jgi:hypothetical protein
VNNPRRSTSRLKVSAILTLLFLLLPAAVGSVENFAANRVLSSTAADDRASGMIALKLYYSEARGDNFTTATADGERDARGAGYRFARVECYLLRNKSLDNVALKLFYSDARGDNFTTATDEGERAARASGYRYVRDEGYLYPDERPGTVPLKLYYSDARRDNFTTATADGERDAKAAGYRYVRIEGYVFPNSSGGGVVTAGSGSLDLAGSWVVTIQSRGDELQGDWTRTDRWEFSSLGGGKWRVRITVLSSRQDSEGEMSGGNPVGKSFEETYTSVNDGDGKFRLIVSDGRGGMIEMPGTYSQSQFSITHSSGGVQNSYHGKRQ